MRRTCWAGLRGVLKVLPAPKEGPVLGYGEKYSLGPVPPPWSAQMWVDARRVRSDLEVFERLVGSAAFKAVGCGEPAAAGSIPVHLRAARGDGPGQGPSPLKTPGTLARMGHHRIIA